jgi:hypothetical protein
MQGSGDLAEIPQKKGKREMEKKIISSFVEICKKNNLNFDSLQLSNGRVVAALGYTGIHFRENITGKTPGFQRLSKHLLLSGGKGLSIYKLKKFAKEAELSIL